MNLVVQPERNHLAWWKAVGLSVAIVYLPFVVMAIYTELFVSCPHCKGVAWQILPIAPGMAPGFLFQMHVTHLRAEWAFWITSGVFEILGLAGLSFAMRRGGLWRLAATIAAILIGSLLAVAVLAIVRA